ADPHAERALGLLDALLRDHLERLDRRLRLLQALEESGERAPLLREHVVEERERDRGVELVEVVRLLREQRTELALAREAERLARVGAERVEAAGAEGALAR